MLLPRLWHWLGLEEDGAGVAAAADLPIRPDVIADTEALVAPVDLDCLWTPGRLEICDALWGDGFLFPGGEAETLRLAKPLGLSAASSLLLLGAGAGGPPCCIAAALGVWVTGYESNTELLTAATERSLRTGLARRARIDAWDPATPIFEHGYYHHALALEPLREGPLEPVLAAIALALKPGGHLMLLETVADVPLDAADPVVAAWQRLDGRPIERLPGETAVTRALGRLGFDVRIVEDVSQRHVRQAVAGWRMAVRGMEQARPTPREAGYLVREAELWLTRIRLIRARRLRLVRWHAMGRG